jgi:hypothetical protein
LPKNGRDVPFPVRRLIGKVFAGGSLPLTDLDLPSNWQTTLAILNLHAIADEACAALALDTQRTAHDRSSPVFQLSALSSLFDRGSLATISTSHVRVLPKLRMPESGLTGQSFSRYVAATRSEVGVRWHVSRPTPKERPLPDRTRISMLLVPWPLRADATDFIPVSPTEITTRLRSATVSSSFVRRSACRLGTFFRSSRLRNAKSDESISSFCPRAPWSRRKQRSFARSWPIAMCNFSSQAFANAPKMLTL